MVQLKDSNFVRIMVTIVSGLVLLSLTQIGVLIWQLSALNTSQKHLVDLVTQLRLDLTSVDAQVHKIDVHEVRLNVLEAEVCKLQKYHPAASVRPPKE